MQFKAKSAAALAGVFVLGLGLSACATPEPEPEPLSCEGASLEGLEFHYSSETLAAMAIVTGDQVTGPFQEGIKVDLLLASNPKPSAIRFLDETGTKVEAAWGPIELARKIMLAPGPEFSIGLEPMTAGCWTMQLDLGEETHDLIFPVQLNPELHQETETPTP